MPYVVQVITTDTFNSFATSSHMLLISYMLICYFLSLIVRIVFKNRSTQELSDFHKLVADIIQHISN